MTAPALSLDQLRERLLTILAGYGRVAVAFSGGVDSAVVAKAARLACGDGALAVTAVSPSLAHGELEIAKDVARGVVARETLRDGDGFYELAVDAGCAETVLIRALPSGDTKAPTARTASAVCSRFSWK